MNIMKTAPILSLSESILKACKYYENFWGIDNPGDINCSVGHFAIQYNALLSRLTKESDFIKPNIEPSFMSDIPGTTNYSEERAMEVDSNNNWVPLFAGEWDSNYTKGDKTLKIWKGDFHDTSTDFAKVYFPNTKVTVGKFGYPVEFNTDHPELPENYFEIANTEI